MRRVDPEVTSLAEKLGDPSLDAKKKNDLETQLLAREQALLPIYTQVSRDQLLAREQALLPVFTRWFLENI